MDDPHRRGGAWEAFVYMHNDRGRDSKGRSGKKHTYERTRLKIHVLMSWQADHYLLQCWRWQFTNDVIMTTAKIIPRCRLRY